jgi:site-specific DNA-methyltransferase (adenine-specific)
MSAPYYQDDAVTLYLGDCLEVTEWLEADVLITDPPYGINGHLSAGYKGRKPAGGFARTNAKPQWDVSLDVRDKMLEQWGARPYAVFGSPARLDAALEHREFPLIWDKGVPGMGDISFPWGRGYEMVYVNGQGWHGRRESPIIRVAHSSNAATKYGHPTPKPPQLMEAIIAKAPAGTIADPFTGSGSTLVAAKALGRKSVGVELDERYCETAANRLAQDVLDFG